MAKIDQLLPEPNTQSQMSILGDVPEVETYANLPRLEWNEAVAFVTKTTLEAAFSLALIAIVIAGIYYLKSDGNEEDTNKAKDILLHLVFGAAVLSVAYGIISGLLKFNVFS